MKKRGLALIMSAAMMFSALTAFGPGSIVKAGSINKSQLAISNFQRLSGGRLKLDLRQSDGLQAYISGTLSGKVNPSANTALNFLEENKDVLGLSNSDNFKAVETFSDSYGNTYVKVNQLLGGLPIDGKVLTVSFGKAGTVSSLFGNVENSIRTITKLGSRHLTMDEAVNKAAGQFTYDNLRQVPVTQRVVLLQNGKAYETYKVNIQYNTPQIGNWNVYVEAYSGKILKTDDNIRYDGAVTGSGTDVQGITRSLNLYQSGSTYQMKDTTKAMSGQILTYTARNAETEPGTLMTSSSTTVSDRAAVSAHYFAGVVYDFYKNVLNRNSLDNSGMTLTSTVHYGSSYNNAFWDGSQMVYGDGDGSEFTYFSGDLDVVGHEMTHGVTERTANMTYSYQPGALNESVSDIFGVLIETYDKYNVKNGGTWAFNASDWVVGDDIYTPGTSGDALRSLANPTLYDQPDNMSNYVNTSSDNGGVHTNSGIPNKAAFLIAQSIGCPETAAIYYKALTTYFGASTDFAGSLDGLVQAATDIYGASSSEVTAVRNAYQSVGIGSGGSSNDTYEPNDTTATAYAIESGTTYNSYIYTSSDVDYYKLTTTGSGTIAVSLSNLPKDYDLYLYNSSGTQVASSTNGSTTSESISYSAAAGTYYIKVIGYSSAYSTTQAYALRATFTSSGGGSTDTYEPNDSTSTAYAINFGTTYNSYIYTASDVDYYKVTASGAGTIGVTLSNLPADYDLYLYNSSGTQVASSTNGSTTAESISYSAAAGTYYIKVIGYNSAYSTSTAYALNATFAGSSGGSDPYEPNDSRSAAYQITSGTTYNGYIGSSTDVDYFKIVKTTSGTISITLSNLPKDYDLYLYNSSGTQLAKSINGGTTSESISYSAAAGTYYIKVIGYSSAYSTTQAYALRATFQ